MKPWPVLIVLLLVTNACVAGRKHATTTVQLDGQRFTAELATNGPARERGLMMRTSLASDRSMLFVFPREGPQAFWMKNTLIPLDILYFDAERRLVSMQQDVPPCKADPCPLYPSKGSARYVLELSAGTARRIGARAGDELKIENEPDAVD